MIKRRSFLKGLLAAIPAVSAVKTLPDIQPITLIEDHWNIGINKRYTFRPASNIIRVRVNGADYYIPVHNGEGAA